MSYLNVSSNTLLIRPRGLKNLKIIGYSSEIQTGPTYEYMYTALRTHQCVAANGEQRDVSVALGVTKLITLVLLHSTVRVQLCKSQNVH